jgi:hypothetical protein
VLLLLAVAGVVVAAGDSSGLILGAAALFLIALGVTATIVLRRNQSKMDRPEPPGTPDA